MIDRASRLAVIVNVQPTTILRKFLQAPRFVKARGAEVHIARARHREVDLIEVFDALLAKDALLVS
jgi:hypothetical protein